ncbi:MAG: hypothetical protein ABIP39_15580 [Polyangiaceae bacterium]
MMRFSALAFGTACLILHAAGCGGAVADVPDADTAEVGVPHHDSGMGPDTAQAPDQPLNPNYPAPHAAMPTMDYNGGRILKSIHIVTVTFGDDPLASTLNDFGDTITSSTWWSTISTDYCDKSGACVGPGTGGDHRVITAPIAASYADTSNGSPSSLQNAIAGWVADGSIPPPTPDTLYAFYFPASTKLTLDGDVGCQSWGAYHNSMMMTPPADAGADAGVAGDTAYAVMPRCMGGLKELTVAASHEFTEAATDPIVGQEAYYMNDPLWGQLGGEDGDLCVDQTGGSDTYQEGSFLVQRIWSIPSAKAGHDPCVPIPPGEVYFNAAPIKGSEQITLAVGESATYEVDAFSDAPMEDWEIHATDLAKLSGNPISLSFSFDRTTVHNGSKPHITVSLDTKPTGSPYALYAIVSKSSSATHIWPAVIIAKK